MSSRRWRCAALIAALALGCGEDKIMTAPSEPSPAAPNAEAAPRASADKLAPPATVIDEADFSEGDRNRDPFRSYARAFVEDNKPGAGPVHDVILPDYSLDELKLIGIVTRVVPAKAMLLDPTGKGHVIRRGQFVGRPDVVPGSGRSGSTYMVNWRVDRIREGDVVLVREDPMNPDVPMLTRVIQLRTEAEQNNK